MFAPLVKLLQCFNLSFSSPGFVAEDGLGCLGFELVSGLQNVTLCFIQLYFHILTTFFLFVFPIFFKKKKRSRASAGEDERRESAQS